MILSFVPFPFSLMGFPKQRLLSWLNTLTYTRVSSAVLIYSSWSKLGESTLNDTAELFIKELKAAPCLHRCISHNQWESRTYSWWVGGGFCMLDCEVYLDCLLKLLHQWGVLSLLSLPRSTSACQGFLNPRTHGSSFGASFLSRSKLPLVSLCQSCAVPPDSCEFMDSARELQAWGSLWPWAHLSAGAHGELWWTGPIPVDAGSWRVHCWGLSCLPGWVSLHFGSCSAVKSLLHVRE